MKDDAVLLGLAQDILPTLHPDSVQLAITSPPYWRKRRYDPARADELGRESCPDLYIQKLLGILDLLKRPMRPDGCFFLNLGDSYFRNSLQGIPWRVALGLAERGWVVRQEHIWSKPNARPESVKNRFTTAHEHLFHLTLSRSRYRFNLDTVRVPAKHANRACDTPGTRKRQSASRVQGQRDSSGGMGYHPLGRGPRTVMHVPTRPHEPLPGGTRHHAVFPPDLIKPLVLSASRDGDLVLDPFCGIGTSLVVSAALGRRVLGIEAVKSYAKAARWRLNGGGG